MITITETAVAEIGKIIVREKMEGQHLRLSVGAGGCSGMQYFLGFDNAIKETDDTFQYEGFQLLIDKNSAPLVQDATLDYSDEDGRPGFIFNNPNAPKPPTCGGSCCC